MQKNKLLETFMRLLITLLVAGAFAALGALFTPLLKSWYPAFMALPYALLTVYAGLCVLGALVGFAFSRKLAGHTLKAINAMEGRWEKLSTQQMVFTTVGLILGLIVAALINQLVLSAGPSLLTISFSALTYLVLGMIGSRVGFRRSRDSKVFGRLLSRMHRTGETLLEEPVPEASSPAAVPRKLLDTSVIIDGRIVDIVKTGFLEGEIVVPQFVLAELRHIADSADSLRRARGRRGLDVLQKLQKETGIVVEETDYPELTEVDVKLLRLCRENGGIVVTNDYNLNKVAGVTGLKVLNINDLSNAVKPMLMAGEELTVQIVREGKEPGQGVAYLDDGTMIVVENGRRHLGETVSAIVTTVLQTSAGRMIFTRLKTQDEKTA